MTKVTNSLQKASNSKPIKFLYSYGGKILPRQTDGKLRYVGGHTRVLSVDRSISYAELIVKFWEACGFSVNLKVKLPTEDLDLLVSVASDEELSAVMEEYDRVSPDSKIRVMLFPVKSLKKISPVPSHASLVDLCASKPPPQSTFGKQQPLKVGFSATKCRQYPVTRFSGANQPMVSRFREQAKLRQNYLVPQMNYNEWL